MKKILNASEILLLMLVLVQCADKGGESVESMCDSCTPNCEGKECGFDECGWVCGGCQNGRVCNWNECGRSEVDECMGRNCGEGTIGGSCGVCPDNWICDYGLCKPEAGGCGDAVDGGKCIIGLLAQCNQGEIDYQFCKYRECVTDDQQGISYCADPQCLPDCFGRECGDDGCGGSCGECEQGEKCDTDYGICLKDDITCGDVARLGECHGHVLLKCENGSIEKQQCLPEGKMCIESDGKRRASCCRVPHKTPCYGLPAYGHCDNGILYYCSNNELTIEPCVLLGWNGCERARIDLYDCR